MRIQRVLALTLTFVSAASSLAASRMSIDDEIAELTRRIEEQRVVVDELSAPWLVKPSLALTVSATPVVDLIRSLNALPAAERTVNFAVDAHNGQLWGWDAPCTFGDESEYIEFDDPNYRVEAHATLSNFRADWLPNQGLRFGVSGDGRIGVGTLRWHKDPCIGGGFGGKAGPASCDGSGRLTTVAQLSLGADRVLRYDTSLNLNGITYGCAISFGSLGDLQFGNIVPSPPTASFEGGFPLPLTTRGVLTNDDAKAPLRKEYEVQLIAPALAITDTGVNVSTDVALQWK